jgi:phosphate transport system protein
VQFLSRLIDLGLEGLTTSLIKMGEIAERAISLSIHNLLEGIDGAEEVRSLSEMIDIMNADAEDKAFELIAKYQPVASDLRIIKSYIKIGYDLERFGRYAWDISFIHNKLANSEKCVHYIDLMEKMREKVTMMVQTSIQSLKTHDAKLAETLSDTENEVDEIYFDYLDRVANEPSITKCKITNLFVIRYLERIADHATYMGESIIYIVTGKKILLR